MMLAHEFHKFDTSIAWQVVTKNLDDLVKDLSEILDSFENNDVLLALYEQGPIFAIEHYQDVVNAKALEIDGKFLLIPGSNIYKHEAKSLALRYRKIRDGLIRKRAIY